MACKKHRYRIVGFGVLKSAKRIDNVCGSGRVVAAAAVHEHALYYPRVELAEALLHGVGEGNRVIAGEVQVAVRLARAKVCDGWIFRDAHRENVERAAFIEIALTLIDENQCAVL